MSFSTMNDNKQRRHFLKVASMITAGTFAPAFASGSHSPGKFPNGVRILFQGDSITDGGRNRGSYYANQGRGLGGGYVYQIAAEILGANPNDEISIYNRGISGNKVYQLAARWEDDCLQLKPDVLSILIGVNDFWHTMSSNYKGTADSFETDLRALLNRTRESLPDVKLIIAEPFAVAGGTAISDAWYPEFHKYQDAVKKISEEQKAAYLPLQTVFGEALKTAPASYWCPDGVHPSIAGSYLMKQVWLDALEKLWD